MPNRYLVIGSRGFIGRNLVTRMSSLGIPFHEVGNKLYKFDTNTLVDLSAITDVRQSIENPSRVFMSNCRRCSQALEFAYRNKMKYIYTSSIGAPQMKSPYSASKLACEALCNSYRESKGLDVSILRLSNVYGPCSEFKTSLISKFIKSCFTGSDFYIYGDGEQTRDFVYVSDVVNAILNASEPMEIVSSGNSVSINYIVRLMQGISIARYGVSPNISNIDEISGEIKSVSCNPKSKPSTLLEDGINFTFNFFEKYYGHKSICHHS